MTRKLKNRLSGQFFRSLQSEKHLIAIGLLLAAMLASSVSTAANIQGPRRSALEKLQEGDVVRNRLLLRDSRFEVVPALAFTLNDAYRRNALFGLGLNYNMSDTLALGGTVQFGVGFDTALKERLADERPDRVASGGFNDLKLSVALEFTYTPIFGKLAFMGRKVLDYDAHFIVGAGAVSLDGGTEADGMAPMLVAGVGLRFFVNPSMAVVFQVKDQLFSSALNFIEDQGDSADGAKSSSENRFRNNLIVGFGYSFFFPSAPKVSD
jgi:outer membrane beta-barrel protein